MTLPAPVARRWWALAVLAFAQFVTIMDTSIIGVALLDIREALEFSADGLSWVFNAYVVAFGGALLLGGRLSDAFGPRRVFSAGLVVLAGGSLIAGFAETAAIEVAGRAVQGLGAALIAPAGLTMVVALFRHDGRELTKAFGLYGASAPAGGTAGVFLGGLLTEWADWRWTLLVNVPLALAVLVAVPRLLPALPGRGRNLDALGAALSTGALALAVFAIVDAPSAGWTSAQTLTGLAVAALLVVAFLAHVSRTREPLLPLGMLRITNVLGANGVMLLLGGAWIPLWFFLNLYLQQVLGYGAFQAGAALLPMTGLILLVMVLLTGRAIGRFGLKPPLMAGLLLLAAGSGLFALVRSGGSFVPDVLWASLVAAAGMALAYVPALNAGLASVPGEQSGIASGLLNTSYQIGSALGLAVITAVASGFGAAETASPGRLTNGYQAAFVSAAAIAAVAALLVAARIRPNSVTATTAASDDSLARAA